MTIQWKQTAWHNKRGSKTGEKVCWRWEGTRPDGRSFVVLHIPHIGFIASSFNGTRLGVGCSLAKAQMLCEQAPCVKVGQVARPAIAEQKKAA